MAESHASKIFRFRLIIGDRQSHRHGCRMFRNSEWDMGAHRVRSGECCLHEREDVRAQAPQVVWRGNEHRVRFREVLQPALV